MKAPALLQPMCVRNRALVELSMEGRAVRASGAELCASRPAFYKSAFEGSVRMERVPRATCLITLLGQSAANCAWSAGTAWTCCCSGRCACGTLSYGHAWGQVHNGMLYPRSADPAQLWVEQEEDRYMMNVQCGFLAHLHNLFVVRQLPGDYLVANDTSWHWVFGTVVKSLY